MQRVVESLDRKINRRRDERVKRMCLDFDMGAETFLLTYQHHELLYE